MEKRKTFTEATAAELAQPVWWPPTVPQRSYLCKTYSRLAWHEHVALIFSQRGSASRSASPDTPHHSGCPGALRARLVKMEQQRPPASTWSSTATCVLQAATAPDWKVPCSRALDARSEAALEEYGRGKETGGAEPEKRRLFISPSCRTFLCEQIQRSSDRVKGRRNTNTSPELLAQTHSPGLWVNPHCKETLRLFSQFHQSRKGILEIKVQILLCLTDSNCISVAYAKWTRISI